jgi:hypothetical protein
MQARVAAGLAMGAMMIGGGGCLNYGNYPPAGEFVWWNARETAGVRELMALALADVIADDLATQPQFANPPAGEPLAAINIPGGISPESYRQVAAMAHPLAVPLSESRGDLPVYQIGQVKLRGREARVDVLRPVDGLSRGVTNPQWAGMQVWFVGNSGSWRLTERRQREVGTLTAGRWLPIEELERKVAEEAEALRQRRQGRQVSEAAPPAEG